MAAWIDNLERAVRDLEEALSKARAVSDASEPELARKIRTGSHEPPELQWTEDELKHWLSSADTPTERARVKKEFETAFDVPPEAMSTLLRRLKTGEQ